MSGREFCDYAVVILYFRAGDVLFDTVRCVLGQTVAAAEVIIVDNASGDGVVSRVAEAFPSVDVLTLPVNLGYAGGMNEGLRRVGVSSFALLLTHEVALQQTAVSRMLNVADQSHAGLIGPVLHTASDGRIWSAGGRLSRTGAPWHSTDLPATSTQFVRAEWLDGAALLVNRRLVGDSALFDDRFFLYWEDVDLGVRIGDVAPVVVALEARAVQSTGFMPPYYASRNRILFWRKRGSRMRLALSVLAQILSALMDLALTRPIFRAPLASVVGIIHGIFGGHSVAFGAIRPRKRYSVRRSLKCFLQRVAKTNSR